MIQSNHKLWSQKKQIGIIRLLMGNYRSKLTVLPWLYLLLAVVTVTLLFFGQALLPGRVLLPTDLVTNRWPPWQPANVPVEVHNFIQADTINYVYPLKVWAAQQVQQGIFPRWNPTVLGGYPLTYNTQAGLFYPFTWLYFVFTGSTAVDLVILGQLLCGGVGMALYLRRLNLSWPAVCFGVLVFLFNWHMVAWLEWQVVHAAIVWLPWQLWLVERSAQSSSNQGRNLVLLAFFFALPWLGGHWNWSIYLSLTSALYAAVRWVDPNAGRRFFHLGQKLFLSFGIGSMLAAVQLLPAFLYLSQTQRQGAVPYQQLISNHALGSRGAAWLMPHFYGSSLHSNFWIIDLSVSNDVETAVYVGLLPIFLATIAIVFRRERAVRFFALWGGLALLWTLGTPAYRLLHWLPVFNGLYPGRAAIVVVIALTILGAFGVDWLVQKREYQSSKFTWTVGGTFVAALLIIGGFSLIYQEQVSQHWGFIRWQYLHFLAALLLSAGLLWWWGTRGSNRRVTMAVIMLLVADLWLVGQEFNTIGHTAEIFPPTETGRFLQEAQKEAPNRIVTVPNGTAYFPNTSQVDQLHNISGYEPGITRRVINYLNTAEGGNVLYFDRFAMPDKGVESPLLDAANVKYIVTIADKWLPEPLIADQEPPGTKTFTLPQQWAISMPEAGLQKVDIWLEPAAGDQELPAAGTVTVRVLSADQTYEFANASQSLAEVEAAGWLSFFFSPFPSEWGREFVLVVESDAANLTLLGGERPAFTAYYLPRPPLAHEAGKTKVYLNEDVLPRAYVVPQVTFSSGESETLNLLLANQNLLDRWAVVENTAGDPVLLTTESNEPPFAEEIVSIERYGINEVIITAELERPGLLVLADTYHEGWRARINGESTKIYRTNSIFRGVFLPAGSHEIHFSFWPLDFMIGGTVSGIALLFCIGLFLWPATKKK